MRLALFGLVGLAVAGAAAFGIYAWTSGSKHAPCVPAVSAAGKAALAREARSIRLQVTSVPNGSVEKDWSDPVSQRTREVAYGPKGKIAEEFGAAKQGRSEVTTIVDYGARTWTTDRLSLPSAGSQIVPSPAAEAGEYRDGVASGSTKVVGRTTIAGRPAVHLRQFVHLPTSSTSPAETVEFDTWVDPTTYLPIRLRESEKGRTLTQTAESWLPPSAADVASTKLVIPTGFKQEHSATSSGVALNTVSRSTATTCHS